MLRGLFGVQAWVVDFVNDAKTLELDLNNGLGPFKRLEEPDHKKPETFIKRNFACPCYNYCIDLAAGHNWTSFTCKGCKLENKQENMDNERHSQRTFRETTDPT